MTRTTCPPTTPPPSTLGRRALLASLPAALLLGALPGCALPTAPPPATGERLRFLGETRLPHLLMFEGTAVGSLSGLDRDPATGRWFTITDDRSELQPARFYVLDLPVGPAGIGPATLRQTVTLLNPAGQVYPQRQRELPPPGVAPLDVPDPEAIRYLPSRGTVLWTSEGDVRQGLSPALHETGLDGRWRRSFELPAHLHVTRGARTGPRNNLGLEGLAVTPDERFAWAAMEGPLQQDGPVPRVQAPGGPCRITRFDIASGRADAQIAYLPDAIPQAPVPPKAVAENGISEVLMIDAHRMLVLERAYMSGVGVSLRLYEIDTRSGSDTLALDALAPGNHRPVAKTLVADFARLGLPLVDNGEGLAWGPTLPNGRRTLVVVSDDNYNPKQVTQFLAFEFIDTP